MRNSSVKIYITLIAVLFVLASCGGPKISMPQEIKAPMPIAGNSGDYMCPYTSDGVMCEWTDKALNASVGSTIGKTAGAYAGSKALEQVPFIGGMLGSMAGESIGRKIAIEASGGWDYIKLSSDLSFNSLEDMAVYLYVKHSSHEHYQAALKATGEIYPDFNKVYMSALVKASRQQKGKNDE